MGEITFGNLYGGWLIGIILGLLIGVGMMAFGILNAPSCGDCFESWDVRYTCENNGGLLQPSTDEYGKWWHCLENNEYKETNVMFTVRAC